MGSLARGDTPKKRLKLSRGRPRRTASKSTRINDDQASDEIVSRRLFAITLARSCQGSDLRGAPRRGEGRHQLGDVRFDGSKLGGGAGMRIRKGRAGTCACQDGAVTVLPGRRAHGQSVPVGGLRAW